MTMKTRNDTLEFARRTRQNLEFIQRAYDKGEDVHPVTQLTVSLLGLVVFLKEKNFVNHIKKRTLEELTKDGWPKWQESKDNCPNLGELVRRLRNAVTHDHITFSSDSRCAAEVVISVEDWKWGDQSPYWQAEIKAIDLRTFCFRFLDLVEQTIG